MKMENTPSEKKCDYCGLFLSVSDFYRNKTKNDGFQARCKDCIKDYKIKLSKGLIEKQKPIKREFFYIPDIFLVGYGRTQVWQNCCLNCETAFFCIQDIREYEDLFCEDCKVDDGKIKEKNTSIVNYIGNVVGWIIKTTDPKQKRQRKSFKKIYERDKYTCQYCGYNLQNSCRFIPLHIDHIKPWSAQGGNGENNLVVSCQECNLLAADKWFHSFEEKKEYVCFEKKKKLWKKN